MASTGLLDEKEQQLSSNGTSEMGSELRDSGKDRGYAWIVLGASFMCQVIACGLALSSGAFTTMLLKEFENSREATAWVGSLHSGCLFAAGPLVGIVTEKYGYRPTIIAGGIISALGMALSACATKLWMLYILYGVIAGTGFSCSYIPAVTILASYFDRWKYVAFSVSATGGGIGVLAMPPVILYFQTEYGWRGGYILTAGVALQVVVFGFLLKSPPEEETGPKLTMKQECTILKDWGFLLFLLNNYLFNFGSLIVFVLISDYAVFRGMEPNQGIYLISIIGICNAVGRALVAIFGMFECNNLILYLTTCSLSGLAICLVTLQSPCPEPCFWVLALCCAAYGLLFGIQLANLAVVTNALVGVQRLNAAYGVVMFLNGAGAATGPPFAGFIYTQFGSMELGYYIAGASVILAGFILIPVTLRKRSVGDEMVSSKDLHTIGDRLMASIPALNASQVALEARSLMDMRVFLSNQHLTVPGNEFSQATSISDTGIHKKGMV